VLVIWQPLCEEESLAWDCSETPESAWEGNAKTFLKDPVRTILNPFKKQDDLKKETNGEILHGLKQNKEGWT
jgi:hypothetical protein